MLKQRIITALLLLCLIVSGILFLPTQVLAMILAIFILIGMLEWLGMPGRLGMLAMTIAVLVLAASLAALYYFVFPDLQYSLLGVAFLWWTLIGLSIALNTRSWIAAITMQSIPGNLLTGFLVLLPAWFSAIYVHQYRETGPYLLLLFFLIVWSADTGAYFTGRRFGIHKLAPAISPGKTWEGVLGGLAAVVVVAITGGVLLSIHLPQLLWLVVIALVTAVYSIAGDLFISICKRSLGIKDTSNLLPGHGGMLDRIDSTLSGLPVYTLGLTLVAI